VAAASPAGMFAMDEELGGEVSAIVSREATPMGNGREGGWGGEARSVRKVAKLSSAPMEVPRPERAGETRRPPRFGAAGEDGTACGVEQFFGKFNLKGSNDRMLL